LNDSFIVKDRIFEEDYRVWETTTARVGNDVFIGYLRSNADERVKMILFDNLLNPKTEQLPFPDTSKTVDLFSNSATAIDSNSIFIAYIIDFDPNAIKKGTAPPALHNYYGVKSIEIYDLMGRKVKTLPAGATFLSLKKGNGVYVVRFVGKGFVQRKIMILK
jgi:hypothetical protein